MDLRALVPSFPDPLGHSQLFVSLCSMTDNHHLQDVCRGEAALDGGRLCLSAEGFLWLSGRLGGREGHPHPAWLAAGHWAWQSPFVSGFPFLLGSFPSGVLSGSLTLWSFLMPKSS